MPDRGTVKRTRGLPRRRPAGRAGLPAGGLLGGLPSAASNALLVSARESRVGHPLAVFGPQTAYFTPQLLIEQDVARPGHRRPRRGVRRHQPLRAARPRPRLRVERHLGGPGHHRHVRACAVRAGRLEADARLDALPLPRPVPADRGAREDEQLDAERGRRHAARHRDAARRAHQARPRDRRARTVRGKPVAYTKLRSTYLHEADSALGLHGASTTPSQISGPAGLPARRREDRLHLQLVLRRRRAHRVLQLRQQPGAGAADELATSR